VSDRSREEVIRSNPNLPLLALPREEAATALGMAAKTFDRVARPELEVVRKGGLLLWPVDELRRWLRENGERMDVAA
jgi:hypothetical protein